MKATYPNDYQFEWSHQSFVVWKVAFMDRQSEMDLVLALNF